MLQVPFHKSSSRRIVLIAALALTLAGGTAHAHGHHGGGGWGWGVWGPLWWGAFDPRDAGIPSRDDPRMGSYASIDLGVDPEEAEILLDGLSIGIADDFDGFPDYLYLSPGRYRIEARVPGYESWSTDLSVHAGQHLRLKPELQELDGKGRGPKGWGKRSPRHATHRFFAPAPDPPEQFGEDSEDESDSFSPDGDWDDEGNQPRPRLPSPRPAWNEDAEDPGEDSNREHPPIAREPLTADLQVIPGSAGVWLDGIPLGEARNLRGKIAAESGEHELVVMKPGFESRVVRFDLREGERRDLIVKLDPIERDE